MRKSIFSAMLILLLLCSLLGTAALLVGCDEPQNASTPTTTSDPSGSQEPNDNVIEYKVLTGAMEPTLLQGHTYLFLKNDGTMSFEVGDIVLFEDWDANGTKFNSAHRVVRVREEGDFIQYFTKGDNNIVEDARWKMNSDLLGKYIGEKK